MDILFVVYCVRDEDDYEEDKSNPLLVCATEEKAIEACNLATLMNEEREVGFRYIEPHPLFPNADVPLGGTFKYATVEFVS